MAKRNTSFFTLSILRWNKANQILIRRGINTEGLLRLKCLFLQRRNVFSTEIIIILQVVKPLLEIQNLSVAFNNKIVVNALSYALFPGKITAVVGESGSGKSVTAMSLLGLLPTKNLTFPSGEIFLSSELIGKEDRTVRPTDEALVSLRGKKIAVIFQEPMTALNPAMTCQQQMEECLQHENKEVRKAKVLSLLEEVEMPDPTGALKKYPHEFSGGQRQRIMIAMALASEPQLLIADEPTTALDPSVQASILELIKKLKNNRNMSVLFISHDLHVVKEIADFIVVMKSGSAVEQGNAEEVLNHPQHDYTRGLLACRPSKSSKGKSLITLGNDRDEKQYSFSESENILLHVEGLTKVYRGQSAAAVNNVSFDIKQGETLGLIGESGCGKTSLSRMLMGLLTPTSGDVSFGNEPLIGKNISFPNKFRRDIQMVFQDPFASLNPKLKIEDMLLEPLHIHKIGSTNAERKKRVEYLLNAVGMPADSAQRYAHNFSGGQRQRIVIARALATNPKLIICDEAVAALDVSVQAQVLNLLNDLKEEFGLTYLFISHDMPVVYHMSNRVMVMRKGEVVEQGSAEEVFLHPTHEYTQRLMSIASLT
jgi:peptide/nickel transport system ATP-binding protein